MFCPFISTPQVTGFQGKNNRKLRAASNLSLPALSPLESILSLK